MSTVLAGALRVLYIGLVNWLVTTIIVEGVVFDGLRESLDRRLAFLGKYTELWHCHLCAGTWVGIVLAVLLGGPLQQRPGSGRMSMVSGALLNGFLYKAVGHIVLEHTALMKHKNEEMMYRKKIDLHHDTKETVDHTRLAASL